MLGDYHAHETSHKEMGVVVEPCCCGLLHTLFLHSEGHSLQKQRASYTESGLLFVGWRLHPRHLCAGTFHWRYHFTTRLLADSMTLSP